MSGKEKETVLIAAKAITKMQLCRHWRLLFLVVLFWFKTDDIHFTEKQTGACDPYCMLAMLTSKLNLTSCVQGLHMH